MAKTQMRHELKHMLNYADYLHLRHRLSKLLARDTHADNEGEYRVRSLYFDTPLDHALMEKINGVSRREKFRLRLYNSDTSYIRLEKKIRRDGVGTKRTAVLSVEEVRRLLEGDIAWMCDSGEPLLMEFYSKIQGRQLRPKTVVEYIRESFTYPAGNVRITLDRDIRTGLTSTDFLNPELPLLNTFEAYAILEIKYDNFLPDLVRGAVRVPHRRQTAFSKYAICRKYD